MCRLRVRVLIVILQVFLTVTAATVILRGNFTKDSKNCVFSENPNFTGVFLEPPRPPTLPDSPPILPDSPRLSPTPPILLSWFPFAVECEVAFPRLSPTLLRLSPNSPRLSSDSPRLSPTHFSNFAVGLREIFFLGVYARICHELLKLLAFSFCVCEGFGVCCRGVLESRVKALATADRRCVVSLFG